MSSKRRNDEGFFEDVRESLRPYMSYQDKGKDTLSFSVVVIIIGLITFWLFSFWLKPNYSHNKVCYDISRGRMFWLAVLGLFVVGIVSYWIHDNMIYSRREEI